MPAHVPGGSEALLEHAREISGRRPLDCSMLRSRSRVQLRARFVSGGLVTSVLGCSSRPILDDKAQMFKTASSENCDERIGAGDCILASVPIPILAKAPPIREAGDSLRVGQTGVTLETLLWTFQQGSTPEDIVDQFPSLTLADVPISRSGEPSLLCRVLRSPQSARDQ